MKSNSYSHKSRSRGNSRRNGSGFRGQSIDSNGPDGKVRGSLHQVHEKYLALARDAGSSGDRITAESFYQHAEHYYRLINVQNQTSPQNNNSGSSRRGRNGSARSLARQEESARQEDKDISETESFPEAEPSTKT